MGIKEHVIEGDAAKKLMEILGSLIGTEKRYKYTPEEALTILKANVHVASGEQTAEVCQAGRIVSLERLKKSLKEVEIGISIMKSSKRHLTDNDQVYDLALIAGMLATAGGALESAVEMLDHMESCPCNEPEAKTEPPPAPAPEPVETRAARGEEHQTSTVFASSTGAEPAHGRHTPMDAPATPAS